KAAALQPHSPALLINLHNIMRQLDRTDKARAACEKLIALQPTEPLHAIRLSTVWPAIFSSAASMTAHRETTEQKWRGWQSQKFELPLSNLTESICEAPF